jgi:hypothetical protein
MIGKQGSHEVFDRFLRIYNPARRLTQTGVSIRQI